MHTWLVNEHDLCAGRKAAFIFGTSDKDTHILYEIYTADNKCTERKLIRLSDENRTFRIRSKKRTGRFHRVFHICQRRQDVCETSSGSTPATGSEIEYPGKRHSVTTCCREARKIGNSVLRMLIP